MLRRESRDTDEGEKTRREGLFGGLMSEERRVAAWIGASIVIKGDLTSSEDMTIAGQVEGDVAVREHTLVIAAGARIGGHIVARSVVVHGAVKGTITAERRVEVGETGSVDGDVVTPRMVVMEGAKLKGRLQVAVASSQPA